MSWEACENNYQRTRHKELIEVLLKDIQENAIWVQFVAPDFRSGPTILLAIRPRELIFDLPRPWNAYLEQARVVYRDKSQILHFFRVRIIETDIEDKTVLTTKPKEIYRLQRRRFYRIGVPEPSKATFRFKDKEFTTNILNISASGMAILADKDQRLPVGETVEDIELYLYLAAGKPFDQIRLPKGRVAREQRRNRGKRLYGIEFLIDNEKDRQPLLKYVLKREIETRKASRL